MAVLKYKKKDGTYATLTNISVKGVDPVQVTGNSVTDVMSQAAVTSELAAKLPTSTFSSYSGTVDTALNGKASQSDLTAHTSNNNIHVTTEDKTTWNGKLDKSAFDTYSGGVATALDGKVDDADISDMATKTWVGQQGYLTEHQDISGKLDKSAFDTYSAATETEIGNKLATSDFNTYSGAVDTALSGKAIKASAFTSAEYNSTDKKIYFKNDSGTKVSEIDATDFIKDGMIDSVELETKSGTTYLVITWNTDAGKSKTELNIGDVFEADNYYTTAQTSGATELSTAFDTKLAISDFNTYSGATDSKIGEKLATSDFNTYSASTKDAIDAKLATSDFNTYSGAVNTTLNGKASQSDLNTLSGTVTAHTADTTIHVTAADKTAWNAKSNFSGSYNDLTDKPSIPSKTSDLTNDSNFATSGYVDTAVNDMATKTWVGEQNYLTEHQDISGKQDVSGMTAYTTTAITSSISGTVTAHTANTDIHVTIEDKTAWNGKQDALANASVLSAISSTDVSNWNAKLDADDITGKTDLSAFTAHTASTVHMTETEKTNLDSLATNIAAISGITASKVAGWDTAAGVDFDKYYLKTETSGATELSTEFAKKADTATTISGYGITDAKIESQVITLGSESITVSSSTQVNTALDNKVDKVSGKGLSTNDYTTSEKDKLASIASGAQVNVQADWSVTDDTSDAFIKSKPTLGTAAAKGVTTGITNSDNLIESKHIYSGVGVTVAYDSVTHYIQLKSTSGNVLSSFDASTFLVDGMVDSVALESKSGTTYLVVTWNTAAGKTATELNIGDIFEADNYLTKAQLTATTDYTTVTKANSANTASTVALTGVTGADDLQAIEALNGTSGILKKTAANTWTLDTTSYSSATDVNTALSGKSDTGHTHDDRYFTQTEITNKIAAMSASTSGSAAKTITALSESNGVISATYANISITKSQVSDFPTEMTPSAHTHKSNEIDGMSGYSKPSSTSAIATGDTLNQAIGKLEKALDNKQASGSYLTATTTYAGSSSVGGAATSAEKLTNTSAVGGVTQPVFFTANGVPSACTYTLGKSVPSDAVFTDNDTTYVAGSFITITGPNNSINVSTGTTNSTVAVGNHTHSDFVSTATTVSAGTGLSGGGNLGSNVTLNLKMPSVHSAATYTATTFTSDEPIVYCVVTASGDLNNQTCPVTLAEGQQCVVIYKTAAACKISFGTSGIITPDGSEIKITTKANGYCEVNYIKLNGDIFLRGV